MLDGSGGLHAFGGAASATGGPYFPGFDIARGLAISGSFGHLLDGFGGLHPFAAP